METFSALLPLCAGNSPVPGEFPAQRPVTQSFDVSFDLRLNTRLCKQSWGWWFETLSRFLWRHCNVIACTIVKGWMIVWHSRVAATDTGDQVIKMNAMFYWKCLFYALRISSPLTTNFNTTLIYTPLINIFNIYAYMIIYKWFEMPLRSLWNHCNVRTAIANTHLPSHHDFIQTYPNLLPVNKLCNL